MLRRIFLTAFLAVGACLLLPAWTPAGEPQKDDSCATPCCQIACDADGPVAERLPVGAAQGKLFQRVYYVGDLVHADTAKAAEFAETLSQTAGEMTKAAKAHDANAVQALNGVIKQAVEKYEAATQPDFEEIIDFITTVVAPDSWDKNGTDILEYSANKSLVVRQTEEVHAEIAELLRQLRKLNSMQIVCQLEIISLADALQGNNDGEKNWLGIPRITMFNGQEACIELSDRNGPSLVRAVPVSATAIDPALEVENEPIHYFLQPGKSLKLKAVASADRQYIRLAVWCDGEKPGERLFHATPFIQEDEEALTGFSVTKTPDAEKPKKAVHKSQVVPILPPLNEKPDCLPTPPSDEEVLSMLKKVKPVEVLVPELETPERRIKGIEKQLISDFVEPPSESGYAFGPVQIHHFHYKCTVHFTETTRVGWPLPHTIHGDDCCHVFYISLRHIHRVEQDAEVAKKPDAEAESPVLQALEDTLIRPVGGVFEQFDNVRLDRAIRHAIPLATPPRPGR